MVRFSVSTMPHNMSLDSTSVLTGLVGCLALLFLWSRRPKNGIALPPGPKPIPILGNIRDIPSKQPWVWATKLAKQYGTIFQTPLPMKHQVSLV